MILTLSFTYYFIVLQHTNSYLYGLRLIIYIILTYFDKSVWNIYIYIITMHEVIDYIYSLFYIFEVYIDFMYKDVHMHLDKNVAYWG